MYGGRVGRFCVYCLSFGLGGCWQNHSSSSVRKRSWWALGTVFWLFGTLVSRATGTPCSLTKLLSLYVKKKKNHLKLGSRQKSWENIFSALLLCRDWLSIMSEQRLMCRFLSVRDANNSVRRDCPKDYGLLSSWTLTSFVSHPKILF